ncbi:sensor histidine kinase, partial [Klebsiella pneumoniae]|uniref:sensor histidine kinase n=1 Tax=Klebsiella pneumoniae TaxID=573 RepID=UPI00272E5199
VSQPLLAEMRYVWWREQMDGVFAGTPRKGHPVIEALADVAARRGLERALQDREAALEASQALKREFVGSVSYELRTPLTTIVGYSELLEIAGDLPDRARQHAGAIRTAAQQLARSIDDVLDMAQIDAGEMEL